MLTIEEFRDALPEKIKKSVSQALVDQVNQTLSNPEDFEYYRSNLIGYTQVLMEGKFKLPEYVNAVRYVGYKIMGMSNIDAYSKTFPDKIARFTAQGVSAKDQSNYVSAYNKSKLVNLIYGQAIIPLHVYNQDLAQKAVLVLADLMQTANSEKVRSDSANALLNHIKPPEVKKVELDIGMREDDSIKALKDRLNQLATIQQQQVRDGTTTVKEMAEMVLVPKSSVIDVDAKQVP